MLAAAGSTVGALKDSVGPAWGPVGGLGVLTGVVILGDYTIIAGWSLREFVSCIGWSVHGFSAFPGNWQQQLATTFLFMAGTMTVIYRGVGKGIERVSER